MKRKAFIISLFLTVMFLIVLTKPAHCPYNPDPLYVWAGNNRSCGTGDTIYLNEAVVSGGNPPYWYPTNAWTATMGSCSPANQLRTYYTAPSNQEGTATVTFNACDQVECKDDTLDVTVYDNDAPQSSVNDVTLTENGYLIVSWTASDNCNPIDIVELKVKFESGSWTDSGLPSMSGTSGCFCYYPGLNGQYYFATVAEDSDGNRESNPSGNGDMSYSYFVQKGDFETGSNGLADGWHKLMKPGLPPEEQPVYELVQYDSNYAQKVTNAEGGQGIYSDAITVIEGATYKISLKLHSKGMYVQIYTPEQAGSGYPAPPNGDGVLYYMDNNFGDYDATGCDPASFVEHSIVFNAPENDDVGDTHEIRIALRTFSRSDENFYGECFVVDDVSIEAYEFNMVENGNFEGGFTQTSYGYVANNWTLLHNDTISASKIYFPCSDSQCYGWGQKIENASGGEGLYTDAIPVVENKRYRLSFKFQSNSMYVNIRDQNQNDLLYYVDGHFIDDNWKEEFITFYTGEDTETIKIYFRTYSNGTTGHEGTWFSLDNVRLTEDENLVIGGGFENDSNGDGMPDHWNRCSKLDGVSRDSYKPNNGIYSVLIQDGESCGICSERIRVQENTQYILRFHDRSRQKGRMLVEIYDITNKQFLLGKTNDIHIVYRDAFFEKQERTFYTPEDCVEIVIYFKSNSDFGVGVDNVSLWETGNILENGDFESWNDTAGRPDKWLKVGTSTLSQVENMYDGGESGNRHLKCEGNHGAGLEYDFSSNPDSDTEYMLSFFHKTKRDWDDPKIDGIEFFVGEGDNNKMKGFNRKDFSTSPTEILLESEKDYFSGTGPSLSFTTYLNEDDGLITSGEAFHLDDVCLKDANLLRNGSFETDSNDDGIPDYWYILWDPDMSETKRVTTHKHHGSWGMQIRAKMLQPPTGNIACGIRSERVKVKPDTYHVLKFWYKGATSSDSFNVAAYDITNEEIIISSLINVTTSWEEISRVSFSNVLHYEYAFKTPKNCRHIFIEIKENDVNYYRTFYIDNIRLIEIGESSGNNLIYNTDESLYRIFNKNAYLNLQNPGFEFDVNNDLIPDSWKPADTRAAYMQWGSGKPFNIRKYTDSIFSDCNCASCPFPPTDCGDHLVSIDVTGKTLFQYVNAMPGVNYTIGCNSAAKYPNPSYDFRHPTTNGRITIRDKTTCLRLKSYYQPYNSDYYKKNWNSSFIKKYGNKEFCPPDLAKTNGEKVGYETHYMTSTAAILSSYDGDTDKFFHFESNSDLSCVEIINRGEEYYDNVKYFDEFVTCYEPVLVSDAKPLMTNDFSIIPGENDASAEQTKARSRQTFTFYAKIESGSPSLQPKLQLCNSSGGAWDNGNDGIITGAITNIEGSLNDTYKGFSVTFNIPCDDNHHLDDVEMTHARFILELDGTGEVWIDDISNYRHLLAPNPYSPNDDEVREKTYFCYALSDDISSIDLKVDNQSNNKIDPRSLRGAFVTPFIYGDFGLGSSSNYQYKITFTNSHGIPVELGGYIIKETTSYSYKTTDYKEDKCPIGVWGANPVSPRSNWEKPRDYNAPWNDNSGCDPGKFSSGASWYKGDDDYAFPEVTYNQNPGNFFNSIHQSTTYYNTFEYVMRNDISPNILVGSDSYLKDIGLDYMYAWFGDWQYWHEYTKSFHPNSNDTILHYDFRRKEWQDAAYVAGFDFISESIELRNMCQHWHSPYETIPLDEFEDAVDRMLDQTNGFCNRSNQYGDTLMGFYITDEPGCVLYRHLGLMMRIFEHKGRFGFSVLNPGEYSTENHQYGRATYEDALENVHYPVLMLDQYPIKSVEDLAIGNIGYEYDGYTDPIIEDQHYVKRLETAKQVTIENTRNNQDYTPAFWPVIQAFGYDWYSSIREPFYTEEKLMSWLALAVGGDGIMYFLSIHGIIKEKWVLGDGTKYRKYKSKAKIDGSLIYDTCETCTMYDAIKDFISVLQTKPSALGGQTTIQELIATLEPIYNEKNPFDYPNTDAHGDLITNVTGGGSNLTGHENYPTKAYTRLFRDENANYYIFVVNYNCEESLNDENEDVVITTDESLSSVVDLIDSNNATLTNSTTINVDDLGPGEGTVLKITFP